MAQGRRRLSVLESLQSLNKPYNTGTTRLTLGLFLTTRRFLIKQARTAIFLLDAICPVPIIASRLFVDAGPLLLHPQLDILTRDLPVPGNQAVHKVASDVCTDKPDPRQGGECEGDE